jgi:hypothetical protein
MFTARGSYCIFVYCFSFWCQSFLTKYLVLQVYVYKCFPMIFHLETSLSDSTKGSHRLIINGTLLAGFSIDSNKYVYGKLLVNISIFSDYHLR